jgi:hypothetical protein
MEENEIRGERIMASNYPAGVTGMEPEISGEYPDEAKLEAYALAMEKIQKQFGSEDL